MAELLHSIEQGVMAREELPQVKRTLDPQWESCKDYVDTFPEDYTKIIESNRLRGVETRAGKLTRTEFFLGNKNSHTIELIEYAGLNGEIKKVWYVAYNKKNSQTYVRYI